MTNLTQAETDLETRSGRATAEFCDVRGFVPSAPEALKMRIQESGRPEEKFESRPLGPTNTSQILLCIVEQQFDMIQRAGRLCAPPIPGFAVADLGQRG